jgi:hypothetical protein
MGIVSRLKQTTEAAFKLSKEQINKPFDYAKIQSVKLKDSIDYKIQERALLEVKAELAMRHKSFEDYSDDELEIMIANQKRKIIDSLKTKSLVAALALLGLDFLV